MDPSSPEPMESEIAALLEASRPAPDPAWRADAERRLVARGGAARGRRLPPRLRVGVAFAAALAALVGVLALAGAGPLGGPNEVEAERDCRTVPVTRTERVPHLVEQPGGEAMIVYRLERVERLQQVCR